jgi:cytidine diphosphoramidate kinase
MHKIIANKHGVIWITGLSGSGKTTISFRLCEMFRRAGINPILVDGDKLRLLIPCRLGYSDGDRRRLARFYAQLSQELAEQGHLVICSTISLFKEIHRRNRRCIKDYFEIWLRVPIEELRRRDNKAFYHERPRKARKYVVGDDLVAEFPDHSDLVLDNWGSMSAEEASRRIMYALGFSGATL